MPSPPRALEGITVIDLAAYIAGPYGTALLADLGAEVIKIEPPEGDAFRDYPSTLEAECRAFIGVNRGKLGLALDLKQPAGLEVLHRLVARADVLVHNFRPGVPERLRIDHAALKAINPRLVYCALTGYGERGPLKDKAGYDQVLQTMTGIAVLQAANDGPPQLVMGSVVDYYAASMLANGVLAALLHRERTGEGQYVAVSLLASALAMQSARLVWAEGEPRALMRDLRSGGINGIHPTRDGDLYLQANAPHFWRALCELTGLAELADDPRYDTVRKRAERADELLPRLRAALATRSALEWEAHFGERVACAAVRRIEDMFDHPQVEAEGLVARYDHPRVGSYLGFTRAVRLEHAPARPARAAPAFGEHSTALLERLGFAADEIAAMRATGVVFEGERRRG